MTNGCSNVFFLFFAAMKQSTFTQFLAKKNKNKSDSSSDSESVVKLDSFPSSSESSDDEETSESSSTDNQEA